MAQRTRIPTQKQGRCVNCVPRLHHHGFRVCVEHMQMVQYSPMFQITQALDRLDRAILKKLDRGQSIQGNTRRPRRRGAPRSAKDSELPIPKKNTRKTKDGRESKVVGPPGGPHKVPLALVDPAWLMSEHGAPFRSGKYIDDWNEAGVVGEIEGEANADGANGGGVAGVEGEGGGDGEGDGDGEGGGDDGELEYIDSALG